MNRTSLTGTLFTKGIPFGAGLSGVRFLIKAIHKYVQDGETKEGSNVISCVIFQCPKEVQKLLLEGDKGLRIEAEGRIHRSSYETESGERRYTQEVWVNPKTVHFCKS